MIRLGAMINEVIPRKPRYSNRKVSMKRLDIDHDDLKGSMDYIKAIKKMRCARKRVIMN